MRLLFSLTLCILSPFSSFCQVYSIEDLPDSILEGSHTVLREQSMIFDVQDVGEANIKHKIVRSLLDESAERFLNLQLSYDQLSRIDQISARLYDQKGELLEEYSDRDFTDVSSYDGISVFSDNRLKTLKVNVNQYPVTISFEYEKTVMNLMFYPSMNFNSSSEVVLYSNLKVLMPENLPLRYSITHMAEPFIAAENGKTRYDWELENAPKVKREPYGPSYQELLSSVVLAPSFFEVDGVEGKMRTWDEFGDFQRKLFQGLDPLPPETIEEIKRITGPLATNEEKIEAIYSFLQNKVRYVSVQLGLGGWRPFSPSYVDSNSFGDCKALSYYTKALLQEVGIMSDYTLVYAGNQRRPIDPDFPRSLFNHAILSVPNGADTIWLECTSQTNPFGYVGHFTGDRDVLVINNEEVVVVKTPTYIMEENRQNRSIKAVIDSEGSAQLQIETIYSGLQYENDNLDRALNLGYEEQREWVIDHLDLPDFQLGTFDMNMTNEGLPVAKLRAEISTTSLFTKTGSRLFFAPNLMNQWSYVPKKIAERKTSVHIQNAYSDTDSIFFTLPVDLYPEFLFEPVFFESEFGTYNSKVIDENGVLVYVRNVNLKSGTFPPSSYSSLRDFYNQISSADKAKIILKKGT